MQALTYSISAHLVERTVKTENYIYLKNWSTSNSQLRAVEILFHVSVTGERMRFAHSA